MRVTVAGVGRVVVVVMVEVVVAVVVVVVVGGTTLHDCTTAGVQDGASAIFATKASVLPPAYAC